MPTKPFQFSTDLRPFLSVNRKSIALQTSFDLGPVNLQTTGSFANNHLHQETDSDSSNIFLASFVAPDIQSKIYSQEVRLLSSTPGPFQWIAGVYAFHLSGDANFILSNRTNPALPLTVRTLDPLLKTTSYAAFGEGTYEIVPNLFLTGGIRYTDEKRKFDQVINGVPVFPQTAKKSFGRTTVKATVRYNINDDTNVYVSYSTGFKSGVFNMTGTSPIATEPESIRALEGGVKADWSRFFRTNLALYRYTYRNLQVTARDPTGPAYILQNAATAEIYGGELEFTVAPSSQFQVRGFAAYNHADYKDFPLAQGFFPLPGGGNSIAPVDASGNQMPRAPRWTFSISPSFNMPLGSGVLDINASLFNSSKVFFDFRNATFQSSYVLVNSEIGWTTGDKKLRVNLFAANVTNEKVIQEVRPGALGTDLRYELPRRLGIGATYNF